MPLPFSSPQEEKDYNEYFSQIQSGFANYGMSDPFAMGTPAISPSGSVWDWISGGAQSIHKAIDPFQLPGLKQAGELAGGAASAAKSVYDVGVFLTDVPRLLITVTGFVLIILGLFAVANASMDKTIQIVQSTVPGAIKRKK